MNKLIQRNFLPYFFYLIIAVFCTSCITTKQIRYFQNVPDSTQLNSIKTPPYVAPLIHPDDILTVSVTVNELAVTVAINSLSAAASSSPADPSGVIVDSLGFIQMPTLGSIKVANLTVEQAAEVIRQRAGKFFLDPVVVVKNRSFKVSVIGEVGKPGTVYINTPKSTLIDLLSLSGDLTAYGIRKNILVFRHNTDNTISTYRVDLTNTSVFTSPVYYLQSGDVIYVEPTPSKAISSDATFNRNLTLGTLGLSVLTTILYLFR